MVVTSAQFEWSGILKCLIRFFKYQKEQADRMRLGKVFMSNVIHATVSSSIFSIKFYVNDPTFDRIAIFQ